MTGDRTVRTESVPQSNYVAEQAGMAIEATRLVDVLEYTYEDQETGMVYDIRLSEDGDVEVEADDPVRLFAGSPYSSFSLDGHITELERGSSAENSPEYDEPSLSFYCSHVDKFNTTFDEAQQEAYLDALVAKMQRVATAWESESGEEPSPYR